MIKERIGTELELVANRVRKGIANGKFTLSEFQNEVVNKTKRAVRQTDYYVHDNAWKLLGITAGVALIGGYFLAKRTIPVVVESVDVQSDGETKPVKNNLGAWELVQSAIPLALFVWRATQRRKTVEVEEA